MSDFCVPLFSLLAEMRQQHVSVGEQASSKAERIKYCETWNMAKRRQQREEINRIMSPKRESFHCSKLINLNRVTWQWFFSLIFGENWVAHFHRQTLCYCVVCNIQFVYSPLNRIKVFKAMKNWSLKFFFFFSLPSVCMMKKMGAWSKRSSSNNKNIFDTVAHAFRHRTAQMFSLSLSLSASSNTFRINFEFLLYRWLWLHSLMLLLMPDVVLMMMMLSRTYFLIPEFPPVFRLIGDIISIRRGSRWKRQKKKQKVFHVTGILMNNGRGERKSVARRKREQYNNKFEFPKSSFSLAQSTHSGRWKNTKFTDQAFIFPLFTFLWLCHVVAFPKFA